MNTRYHPWNEVAHLFITGSRVGQSFWCLSLFLSHSVFFSSLFPLSLSLLLILFFLLFLTVTMFSIPTSLGDQDPPARANVALSEITHLTRPVTRWVLWASSKTQQKITCISLNKSRWLSFLILESRNNRYSHHLQWFVYLVINKYISKRWFTPVFSIVLDLTLKIVILFIVVLK